MSGQKNGKQTSRPPRLPASRPVLTLNAGSVMVLTAVSRVTEGDSLAAKYHSSSLGSLPSHGAHSPANYESFRVLGGSFGSSGVCA